MPEPSNEPHDYAAIEASVLRALSNAVDAVTAARAVTRNAFVADYCANALLEIKRAMRIAIGSTDAR